MAVWSRAGFSGDGETAGRPIHGRSEWPSTGHLDWENGMMGNLGQERKASKGSGRVWMAIGIILCVLLTILMP